MSPKAIENLKGIALAVAVGVAMAFVLAGWNLAP